MYIHVSKCKNDKIKGGEKKNFKPKCCKEKKEAREGRRKRGRGQGKRDRKREREREERERERERERVTYENIPDHLCY
jgi:hypothetical protein